MVPSAPPGSKAKPLGASRCAQHVGDNPTDEQLEKLPEVLNSTRHVCPRFEVPRSEPRPLPTRAPLVCLKRAAPRGQAALGLTDLDEDEGSQYTRTTWTPTRTR